MAMVLQPNRVTSSNSSTVPMDSSTNQEDTFHRKIFDKIEESKRDRDPGKCHQILDDLMKMLKHLTADVNNYNKTFCETRPTFYMQEFARLTDRIEVLTKAHNTLTEFVHELENQKSDKSSVPCASSSIDVPTTQQIVQPSPTASPSNRSSPPERFHHQHTSSTSSMQSSSRENFPVDYSTTTNTHENHLTSSSLSTQNNNRSRSPSMTPSNFIRVHFPNKHTTALAPRPDETLEAALESRAQRHSVINLRAYTPVYKVSRKPCPWDIPLDRLIETEIEFEEKPKLDHSFENMPSGRLSLLMRFRCLICERRIREAHKHCISCGNHYHNECCAKSPVCSQVVIQHIKHVGIDSLPNDRNVNSQNQPKEQSRSLSRIPAARPGINTNPGLDSPKRNSHEKNDQISAPIEKSSNILTVSPPSKGISSSRSSNSLLQKDDKTNPSSLPSSNAPIHDVSLFLRGNCGLPLNPESLRPSLTKNNPDTNNDTRKPTKHISEWEIRTEDLLSHGRMVGRGTYGTVYKAEVRLHGNVALKELNFISPTDSQFQAFRNEVYALKKITHQNTLNFYGYIISPRFAIVTQWCEGSTLYKHIHILDRHWKINPLIDIARQICQGMSYLHDRCIIHRDLKSSNVFLDTSAEPDETGGNWRVKIGDFGLAAVKTVPGEGVNQQSQPTGSVLWMAPEVIQQKGPDCYSQASDVYAYGCVLFEMFSGKLPHAPMTNKEQIMWLVGKGRLKLKVEQCRDDTPEAITELIRQCNEYDRSLRPRFAPEIDDTLSKFEFIFPCLQRSQSEPYLPRSAHDDILGLPINFGVPKTPMSVRRRFNAEVS